MLNTLKVQNEEHEKRVAKQQEKRRFILKYTDQLQQKTAKHVEELNLRYADIQQLRRKHTSDLIACIFPVTEEKCERFVLSLTYFNLFLDARLKLNFTLINILKKFI